MAENGHPLARKNGSEMNVKSDSAKDDIARRSVRPSFEGLLQGAVLRPVTRGQRNKGLACALALVEER